MTIKIVLTDSHQVIRQGLSLLLAGEPDMGVVGEAGDCFTTIGLIQEFSPQVVILDSCLPDCNGFEATRQIASQFPHIKIIALTVSLS